MGVLIEKNGAVWTVILNRPQVKNAVDGHTAQQLSDAFRQFESDDKASVAVLWGAGGTFCSGADLNAFAEQKPGEADRLNRDMAQDGPMGPSRMFLKAGSRWKAPTASPKGGAGRTFHNPVQSCR